MATSKLDIKIKALVEGLEGLSKLAAELLKTDTAAQKAGAGAKAGAKGLSEIKPAADSGNKSLQDILKQLKGMGDGFQSLIKYAKAAAAAYLGFLSISKLSDAAKAAARVETLGVTLQVVGRNAGYSKDQLAEYEKQVKSMGITTEVTRDIMTKLIQAGINLSETNKAGVSTAAQLARAAQDLAVVTGASSSETLQRLIVNIQQLDTVGLRYQGLIVNREAAEAKFAQTLGKTADQLSQQQKTQAFLNATMEQAAKLTGAYEESLETVGKKVGSLQRYQEELAVTIGNKLLPAYGAVVDAATDLLKNLEAQVRKIDETGESSRAFGQIIKETLAAVGPLVEQIVGGLGDSKDEIILVAQQVGSLVKDLLEAATSVATFVRESEVLRVVFYSIGLFVAGLRDGIKLLTGMFQGFLGVAAGGVGQLLEAAAQLADYLGKTEMSESLAANAQTMREFGAEGEKALTQVIEDFQNGKTAVQEFLTTAGKTREELEKMGKTAQFLELEEELRQLNESITQNKFTSQEASDSAEMLGRKLASLAIEGKITGQEFFKLTQGVNSVKNAIADQFNKALQDLSLNFERVGKTGPQFLVPLNTEFSKIGGSLITLAQNAETTGPALRSAFSVGAEAANTINDLNKLAVVLEDFRTLRPEMQDLSGEFGLLRTRFSELFQEGLKAAKTTEDFDFLTASVIELGQKGVISQQQVTTSLDAIATQAAKTGQSIKDLDLSEPLARMGISLEELRTGVSAATLQMVKDLTAIVDTAKLTSDQLYQVFNRSIRATDSLEGLQLIAQELERTRQKSLESGQALEESFKKGEISVQEYSKRLKEGRLDTDEYNSSVAATKEQFTQLFDEQLRAAKTQEDLEKLTQTVIKMGNDGTITGQQVSVALGKIRESATGAKAEIAAISAQQVALATQQTAVVRAQNDVYRASIEVQRARGNLVQAEIRHQKEGTALSKAQLDLAKAQLQEKIEMERVARIQAEVEQASMTLLIAQQKELNTLRQLEMDPGNERLQAQAAAQSEQVRMQQLVVNQLQQQLQLQQQSVDRAGLQVDKAGQLVEKLEQQNAQVQQAGQNMQQFANGATMVGTAIASWNFDSVVAAITAAGVGLEAAEGSAQSLIGLTQRVVAFGNEGVEKYLQIYAGVMKVVEAHKQQVALAEMVESEYAKVKRQAQLMEQGISGAADSMYDLGGLAAPVGQAFMRIREDARATAQAAADSVRAFMNMTNNIRMELLQAQGREDEAARMRYAQRKQELALEYKLLEVKLKAAMITAQEAGLAQEAAELKGMLADIGRSYQEAQQDLQELERLELQKLRKQMQQQQTQYQQMPDYGGGGSGGGGGGGSGRGFTGTNNASGVGNAPRNLDEAMQTQQFTEILQRLAGALETVGSSGLQRFTGEETAALLDGTAVSTLNPDGMLPRGDTFNINGNVFGADPKFFSKELARMVGPELEQLWKRGGKA